MGTPVKERGGAGEAGGARRRFLGTAGALLLIVVGLFVYRDSPAGAWIFDDFPQIVQNPHIRRFPPARTFLANTRRPLLYVTFAWNHALGGTDPRGYHIVNLGVHLAAACVLFVFLRATFDRLHPLSPLRRASPGLALTTALLWETHPLLTQAVTYVVQRAESLAALFYLLTLTAASRFFRRPGPGAWTATAVFALCGVLVKETVITVPLVVWVYDRTFVSGGWRAALRRHAALYGAFLPMTSAAVGLLITARPEAVPTAGFGLPGVDPLRYLSTQAGVLFHYLRLVFWPRPLIFDYGWPLVDSAGEALSALMGLGALLGTLGLLRRSPVLGAAPAAFFLMLAPSSSVIPLKDPAFEYRMYLPSACVLAFVVSLGWIVLRRIPRRGVGLGAAGVLVFGALVGWSRETIHRNRMYRDPAAVWRDVLVHRPDNPRAHNNLGEILLRRGRIAEAVGHFQRALDLDPSYADVWANLGAAYARSGDPRRAVIFCRQAVALDPGFALAYNNLGAALADLGRYEEAVPFYEKAIALDFREAGVFHNLGAAYARIGRRQDAVEAMRAALRIDPDDAATRRDLAEILRNRRNEARGETAR